ncbi:MAG: hypothetical protein EHM85_02900 [Desulfobacteraceae bacterium]|nr:MAG: hypothetical protein EHM85_02900 [Desulfobacteraceae bacterium]
MAHAEEIFSKEREPDQGPIIKDLHAKIGQLSMENDFLLNALGRITDPSAKRFLLRHEHQTLQDTSEHA